MLNVIKPSTGEVMPVIRREMLMIERVGKDAYFTHFDVDDGKAVNPKVIDAREIVDCLGGEKECKWLDPRIIIKERDVIAWQYSPQNIPLYLRHAGQSHALSIKWPHLVFVRQGNSLKVAVTRYKTRIKPETRLYHLPIPNVYASSRICLGNVRLPDDNNDIDAISHAYLNSNKTHLNNSDKIFRGQSKVDYQSWLDWIKSKSATGDVIRVSELEPMGTAAEFLGARLCE